MPTVVTKTVKPSGGDYTTLAAAVAAEVNGIDLVTADIQIVIECFDLGAPESASGGLVIGTGATTDATHFATIRAAASHGGKWNTSVYRIQDAAAGAVITVASNDIRLIGLQIEAQGVGAFQGTAISASGAARLHVEQCIARCTASGATNASHGFAFSGVSGPLFLSNNIVYGWTFAGSAGVSVGFNTGFAYNNTVYNCALGFQSSDVGVTSINNIAATIAGSSYGANGWHAGSGNNVDTDGSAPGTGNHTGAPSFVSTTAGAEDLHLTAGDAIARGNGLDLSGDANYPITVDVDGQTRNAPWDIGADQFVATGGGTTNAMGDDATSLPTTLALPNPAKQIITVFG